MLQKAVAPIAIEELQAGAILSQACELRQNKHPNNLVEQDPKFIQKLVNLGLGFKSFHLARRTPIVYETMNSIRKGQLVELSQGDILERVKFIAQIFEVAA